MTDELEDGLFALTDSGELFSLEELVVAPEPAHEVSTSAPSQLFELCGPLPTGTTVVEASAGTGKTYAIVGLAVRFVAEAQVPVSRLLLVTFSRAATQELRERTRERVVAVAAALADPDAARASGDALIHYLASVDDAEVHQRRGRLMAALSDFDSATITTIHGFCQRMLDELGFAGDAEAGVQVVDNVDDLVTSVVDDMYLARYARSGAPMTLRQAHLLGAAVVRDRQAQLAPQLSPSTATPDGQGDDPDAVAAERVAFAAAVRAETQRRKRLAGLRDFEDLPMLLHQACSDPEHGTQASQRIRDRFQVVLVDEFQDTDPVQWDILRSCFHGHASVVLVGDPKQAIYGFRGAEVLSYLDAVARTQRRELTVNWRSDAALVAALAHLTGGAQLGHADIAVGPVLAAAKESPPTDTPLRLRYLPRTGAGPLNRAGLPAVDRQRARVAEDLAENIVRVLDADAEAAAPRFGPRDIAVLVRTRAQVDLVRAALDARGVASVLAGGSSVFDTESATAWLWLLRALQQPHRADRVRLAAATALLGCSVTEIDSGGMDLVGRMAAQLREAGRLAATAGYAAVFEKLSAETGLGARLVSVAGGRRQLTDLRHIAQLLDHVVARQLLGPTAVTRWLADRIREPATGAVGDRSRRLDRDDAAVQVATVHASKGLQFPLVYLPFAWDSAKNPDPVTLIYHEDGQRMLDVGGPQASGYLQRRTQAEREEAGEELRLLYVALTRARSHVVAWWAPCFATATAPLHRLMLGREPGSAAVPERAEVPSDNAVAQRLAQWASAAGPDLIAVEPVSSTSARTRPVLPPPPVGELAAAVFDREIDQHWRRTSYSALTAAAHDRELAMEETPGVSDEPAAPAFEVDEMAPAPVTALPSLMNGLPAGAEFGTLVHEVLETVDTGVADLAAEVQVRCADAVEHVAATEPIDSELLARALLAVLHTPLGVGCLAAISPRDRLSELAFELPLAGGDAGGNHANITDLANLLRDQLPPDDPFIDYPDRLATLGEAPLRGYLTGSVDAVLRVGPADQPQFVVVDYKTNRLGAGDLTVANYTPEKMIAEMIRSHYPLQAILYCVAVHRYLRWRLPHYRPEQHLGGVRYLFVRGMVGPQTPPGCGVLPWNPPPALIAHLSDLLAGGVR